MVGTRLVRGWCLFCACLIFVLLGWCLVGVCLVRVMYSFCVCFLFVLCVLWGLRGTWSVFGLCLCDVCLGLDLGRV